MRNPPARAFRSTLRMMQSTTSTSSTCISPSISLADFRSQLQFFASSSSSFLVVHTVPSLSPQQHAPQIIHVLDSSFNSPTRAHFRIALSALHAYAPKPQRLLLLLATQNADKAPKPASFEQRLAMMRLLAQDVQDQYTLDNKQRGGQDGLAVDVGITKKPYFHDKAISIEESGFYTDDKTGQQPEQVHLLGFDSLIRLLDTKYYPPEHTLAPIDALFARHRIRVTRRTEEGNKWGTPEEQNRPREALANGEREEEKGKREWAERIEMVEGESEAISSTKVREAAAKAEWEVVERLVGKKVREWIESERLYQEDEKG
ncbi:MAG: hypothetical protein LQ338_002351 [Usnochroma carphineum]|nr:MAG: hypothetical protein LQ338_002351 [Usnochroma carphineum]